MVAAKKTTQEHATAKKHTTENKFLTEPQYAIIRIKGQVNLKGPIKDTLSMLNIHQKNHCALIKITPQTTGMIKKVKDHITWGEASEETIKLLVEKRAETNDKGEIKNCFRLSPPRGGFERKGTKKSFTEGGALGYRGEKINDLIKKMI